MTCLFNGAMIADRSTASASHNFDTQSPRAEPSLAPRSLSTAIPVEFRCLSLSQHCVFLGIRCDIRQGGQRAPHQLNHAFWVRKDLHFQHPSVTMKRDVQNLYISNSSCGYPKLLVCIWAGNASGGPPAGCSLRSKATSHASFFSLNAYSGCNFPLRSHEQNFNASP